MIHHSHIFSSHIITLSYKRLKELIIEGFSQRGVCQFFGEIFLKDLANSLHIWTCLDVENVAL